MANPRLCQETPVALAHVSPVPCLDFTSRHNIIVLIQIVLAHESIFRIPNAGIVRPTARQGSGHGLVARRLDERFALPVVRPRLAEKTSRHLTKYTSKHLNEDLVIQGEDDTKT